MITTNCEKIYKRLLRLRSHGINKLDDNFMNIDMSHTNNVQNLHCKCRWDTYRITDIQCALGKDIQKITQLLKEENSW